MSIATNQFRETQTLMKAMRFYAPGDLRYEDVPMPIPGPGEIVVKIETALTCGTDLKTFRRGHPVLLKTFPSPFGHEGAGTVYALGDGVKRFQIGDRVVAANSAPCERCFFCLKQQYNLCETLDLLNGTYAEYLKVPERITRLNTLKIPDQVPFEAAAFTEPLAVSLRGIDACRLQPGDHVAVIGLGAMGQLLIKLAKNKGAHVTALGRTPLKRELAQSFAGADIVVDITSKPEPHQVIAKHTPGGYGFDVVIEAVGQPDLWEYALKLVRRGGLVNLFAGCPRGTTMQVDSERLHYDEITLMGLFHHTPAHFQKALALIASGEIDPLPLISHRLPMGSLVEALELVAEGEAVKVAIKP
jgi:L-iditol 2-dehydrogenase